MMNWRDLSRSERSDCKNVSDHEMMNYIIEFSIPGYNRSSRALDSDGDSLYESSFAGHYDMIYGTEHPTTDTVLSRFQQECPEVNQESGCFRNQNASPISFNDAERSSSVLSLNCCSPLCWESGFSWKYSAPAWTADHW